jgi:hypothetical protein
MKLKCRKGRLLSINIPDPESDIQESLEGKSTET